MSYCKRDIRRLKKAYNIIINGKCGNGKDTFINYCSQYVLCNNISTIDSLRFLANQVFYYEFDTPSINKSKEYRNFLHHLKRMIKKYNPNYFMHYVNGRLRENTLNFIHVREENEFKDYGQCVKVLVINPNLNQNDIDLSDIDQSNKFNDINYDHIILNDGDLNRLKEKAKIFTDMFS
jgi:hypothetical protein